MNTILVLRGPVGVGKSTISKIIQEKLGVNWAVIDVDSFKKFMHLKEGESNRMERARIAQDVSKYFAKEMYAKGYNVILEEMYKKPYNDSLVEFLNANDMRFMKVFLSAPLDVTVQRVGGRAKFVPEAEIARHNAEIEPYADDFVVDTTQHSSEESADLIIAELQRSSM